MFMKLSLGYEMFVLQNHKFREIIIKVRVILSGHGWTLFLLFCTRLFAAIFCTHQLVKRNLLGMGALKKVVKNRCM